MFNVSTLGKQPSFFRASLNPADGNKRCSTSESLTSPFNKKLGHCTATLTQTLPSFFWNAISYKIVAMGIIELILYALFNCLMFEKEKYFMMC